MPFEGLREGRVGSRGDADPDVRIGAPVGRWRRTVLLTVVLRPYWIRPSVEMSGAQRRRGKDVAVVVRCRTVVIVRSPPTIDGDFERGTHVAHPVCAENSESLDEHGH